MSIIMLCLTGCASAPSGGQDSVTFLSAPDGAVMTASNGMTCVTPCSLRIRRDEGFTATFTKAGFSTQTADVGTRFMDFQKSYDFGPVSFGVAAATVPGDDRGLYNMEHTPNPVSVTLQPN